MQVKAIQAHQEKAAALRERLQAPPGTPAKRIILKPGMPGHIYNQSIRQLDRHEKAAAKLIQAGIKKKM